MMQPYQRVIVLGVDGAGTFFAQAETPCMDEIMRYGSVTYRAHTSIPTISAECWGSMLHGVEPAFHRLTNSIASARKYDIASPYPSFFRVIREQRPDAVLASFCNWEPINNGIIEDNLNVYMDTASDDVLTDKIINYIQTADFTAIFVQFDSVDGAGHANGYGTPNHLRQITEVDGYIGRIIDALRGRNLLEDTLLIISADHGGTPQGGHGGITDAEKYIFIGAAGKTVVKGEMGGGAEVSVRDIAAMTLYALGIDCPDTWTAIVPANVFAGHTPCPRPQVPHPTELRTRQHTGAGFPEALDARTILRFAGDVTDLTGKTTPRTHGILTYTDGRIGQAADFSGGHVTIASYKLGSDSFTAAFWFCPGEIEGDPAILSNKDWQNGANCGFVLAATPTGILYNVGNGTDRADFPYLYPHNYRIGDGWLHIILSLDRETNTVSFFYNFAPYDISPLPSSFRAATIDALALCIGQDGTQRYPYPLKAKIEDLHIYSRSFTSSDAKSLQAMYHIE